MSVPSSISFWPALNPRDPVRGKALAKTLTRLPAFLLLSEPFQEVHSPETPSLLIPAATGAVGSRFLFQGSSLKDRFNGYCYYLIPQPQSTHVLKGDGRSAFFLSPPPPPIPRMPPAPSNFQVTQPVFSRFRLLFSIQISFPLSGCLLDLYSPHSFGPLWLASFFFRRISLGLVSFGVFGVDPVSGTLVICLVGRP